jgi:hypothetical protein
MITISDAENVLIIIKKAASNVELLDKFLELYIKQDFEAIKKVMQVNGVIISENADIKEAGKVLKDIKKIGEQKSKITVLKIIEKVISNVELLDALLDPISKKDYEQIKKAMSEHDVRIDNDKDVMEACVILLGINKIELERFEQRAAKVGEAFRDSLVNDVTGLKKGYDRVMTMYTIAFYIGVVLIGVSVISAFLPPTMKDINITTLFAGIGAADLIGSLIFRPASELQKSRANSILLNATYFTWVNDLSIWNSYLRSLPEYNFTNIQTVSKMVMDNLQRCMHLVAKFPQWSPEKKDKNTRTNDANNNETKQ